MTLNDCLVKHKLRVHPAADKFPLMKQDALKQLAYDIKVNGLHHSILIDQEVLIDGRNRLLACGMVEMEPRFQQLSESNLIVDSDPSAKTIVNLLISQNMRRRDLTANQKAQIVVNLEDWIAREEIARKKKANGGRKAAPGRPAEKDMAKPPHLSPKPTIRRQLAEKAGVGEKMIQAAINVAKHDCNKSTTLGDSVRKGNMTLAAAEKQIKGKAADGWNLKAALKRTGSLLLKLKRACPANQQNKLRDAIQNIINQYFGTGSLPETRDNFDKGKWMGQDQTP